jgi:hypothetical protein
MIRRGVTAVLLTTLLATLTACGAVERLVGTPLPTTDLDPPAGWAWHDAPRNHRGELGDTLDYVCPAGGGYGPIWGTDVYTDDSSVCTAAVHMGFLDRDVGGRVRIVVRPGQEGYPGSIRNGVVSEPYGSWGGSFVVVAACQAEGCAPAPP